MNLFRRQWGLWAVLIGVVVFIGCSSNKNSSEAPGASSQSSSETVAPGGAGESDSNSGAVIPAGTVAEIWTQIDAEKSKLSSAIQSGELKDVHHLAYRIRDLAVALTDKAAANTPAMAPRVNGMVEQLRTSASELDKLGDAGDRSGAQTEFAKLSAILDAIRSVTGSS
jgi:hypothetical protein